MIFCGEPVCDWEQCYDCAATANHVAVFTGLSVDELSDLGGFGCRGM